MSALQVNAYAATEARAPLEPFQYDLPELGPEEVDVKVDYCGICHSDLSMLNNDWEMTSFPFVPGHEASGTVVAVGEHVKGVSVGDRVGVGWFSQSCLHCHECLSGHHNLCLENEATIVGRHGGFADHVRCHWLWATPLPDDLDLSRAGPLLCGGITVFNPIVVSGVQPTDRVGVVGIGGLGHMALQFLNAWGCEVTAFSSSPDKTEEAKQMGAHHVVNSRDDAAMEGIAGSMDFILNTTNVNLNWQAYLNTLAPNGTFHNVGAVPDPIPVDAFTLLMGQKRVAGSPLGSPALTRQMLEFCTRHDVAPVTEEFAMADVNDAMEHLKDGQARYRIVLKA